MYVLIWEYEVRPECIEAFVAGYGPGGAWARFFRGGEGYLGTDLLRDADCAERFATIDRWLSAGHYDRFRAANGERYREIDRAFETLMQRETAVGSFERVA